MLRGKVPAGSLFINYFLTSLFRDEITVGLEHFSEHIVLRYAVILAAVVFHKEPVGIVFVIHAILLILGRNIFFQIQFIVI